MDKFSAIRVIEEGATLRIAWDNLQVRKDNFLLWFLIIFWIVWAPVTLLVTCIIFLPDLPILARIFFLIWSIFGWAGTLGIPYAFIGRRWSEWIEVSKASLSCGSAGFLARKSKILPLDTIIELGCGWYGFGRDDKPETVMTLNIFQTGGFLTGQRRYTFGHWLAPELKLQVFKTIEEFVHRQQIPLQMTRYHPQFGRAVEEHDIAVHPQALPKNQSLGIRVSEDGETLRVQWDNRRVDKHYVSFLLLLVVWMVWTSATVVVTYGLVQPHTTARTRVFGGLWAVFGWVATLGFAYLLLQRYWSEWIEISKESVSHGFIGLFARKPKRFLLKNILEIGMGQYGSCSFGISHGTPSRPRTHLIGYWLAPEIEEQVFRTIEEFVARKEIPLRMTRYTS